MLCPRQDPVLVVRGVLYIVATWCSHFARVFSFGSFLEYNHGRRVFPQNHSLVKQVPWFSVLERSKNKVHLSPRFLSVIDKKKAKSNIPQRFTVRSSGFAWRRSFAQNPIRQKKTHPRGQNNNLSNVPAVVIGCVRSIIL